MGAFDFVHKKHLTVRKSKTDAGMGREIPLNDAVLIALDVHAAWYIRRFGSAGRSGTCSPPARGNPTIPLSPLPR